MALGTVALPPELLALVLARAGPDPLGIGVREGSFETLALDVAAPADDPGRAHVDVLPGPEGQLGSASSTCGVAVPVGASDEVLEVHDGGSGGHEPLEIVEAILHATSVANVRSTASCSWGLCRSYGGGRRLIVLGGESQFDPDRYDRFGTDNDTSRRERTGDDPGSASSHRRFEESRQH